MNRLGVQPLRAAFVLGGLVGIAVALLIGIDHLTGAAIAKTEQRAQRQALALVLPSNRYDNDPISDAIKVQAEAWLGSAQPLIVWRARRQTQATALILEAVAPDGYAGPLRLLIAIGKDGRVAGVRVTAHQETPGLGDAVEPRVSDWITGFSGRTLGSPPLQAWAVQRDGGAFDQFAGATITPRAVVAAVRRSLQLVEKHGEPLYRAPPGSLLRFDDAPEQAATTDTAHAMSEAASLP